MAQPISLNINVMLVVLQRIILNCIFFLYVKADLHATYMRPYHLLAPRRIPSTVTKNRRIHNLPQKTGTSNTNNEQ